MILTVVAQEELVFIRPEHAHRLATVTSLGQVGMSGIIKRRNRHAVEAGDRVNELTGIDDVYLSLVKIHDFEAFGTEDGDASFEEDEVERF